MKMALFGVIVCPNCRNATAIDLDAKTNACRRCGKRHQTPKLVIYFNSESSAEIAAAVSKLNEEIHKK